MKALVIGGGIGGLGGTGGAEKTGGDRAGV